MEPAGPGQAEDEQSFVFPPQRRPGAGKSHRRAASSPAIDHDFGRSPGSMYSSGPFGVLGESSNGLFSPRLAIGLSKGHRETASGDFTMSTEAGDTSFTSSLDSLFHRGGLESLRSDFLKMDLGRRRISEDERERVGSHLSSTESESVRASTGGGGSSRPASLPRSFSATEASAVANLSVSTADVIHRTSDRNVVSPSNATLRMLAATGGTSSTTVRLSPSAGAPLDVNGGTSSVAVSGVLGTPRAGGSGSNNAASNGPSGDSGRGPSAAHQNHHAATNGRVSRSNGVGQSAGGREGGDSRDRRSNGGGSGGYRSQGGSAGRPSGEDGGQTWINGSGDEVLFNHQEAGGASGVGLSSHSPPPPPGGVPMYTTVHGGDGYSTMPMQHTYTLNGDSYGQGVVGHVPPHGLNQLQGPQGGTTLDSSASVGDQQLLGPHLSGMSSPPHPPVPAPQHMFMSSPGTYMIASGSGARSNGSASSGGAGSGGPSGSGGSGNMQPPIIYGHQGNGPAQQTQQQSPHQSHQQLPSAAGGAESVTHGAASPMYLPLTQAGYQYAPPHLNHLQSAGGLPMYQMASGPEGSPGAGSGRPNGVTAGGPAGAPAAGVNPSGRGNTGSPPLSSLPAAAAAAAVAQGFQVHYALTPQGIVPMVPIMPNGAGGFANPALYSGVGGVYDDGRGGVVTGGSAGMDGVDKGRMSPTLPGGGPIPGRFPGSPHPHAGAQHLHAGIPGGMQPMHAPGWSVGGAGVHDGGPAYHDAARFNDRGYPGGGPDGFRGGPGGRDARMPPRDPEAGKDVKDRRKRLDRESDMAALLEATRPALKDVLGKVYSMSRDQVGCRLLQQKLDECPDRPPDGDAGKEGAAADEEDAVSAIFEEALPDLPQMMIDPFGNYLFQKLFVKIDDHQRLLAVEAVTERMPEAAVNLHGTRCVQKVVELCRTDAQAAVIARSLGPSVVKLSLDPNGNHVVQRALQHMPAPRNDFVLEAITASLVQVAVHRHGCCVLQRCLDAAGPKLRIKLVDEVARNGLKLMQDPFGNYVVQYVLKTCSREETYQLCSAPLGHVASLSTQKFSSNVMEACLERALPEVQSKFVEELAQQGRIRELILDQYANYVVQRALTVANNEEGLKLVAAIRPHLHSMQSTSSGRRIAAKIIKRYPTVDLGEEILMLMSRG